ncbi:MAG: hypothetical protein M9907_15340 [Burkholderiaceae bacterium]|nr:hypothetical protein [Burkholderiaceae bacterium]
MATSRRTSRQREAFKALQKANAKRADAHALMVADFLAHFAGLSQVQMVDILNAHRVWTPRDESWWPGLTPDHTKPAKRRRSLLWSSPTQVQRVLKRASEVRARRAEIRARMPVRVSKPLEPGEPKRNTSGWGSWHAFKNWAVAWGCSVEEARAYASFMVGRPMEPREPKRATARHRKWLRDQRALGRDLAEPFWRTLAPVRQEAWAALFAARTKNLLDPETWDATSGGGRKRRFGAG